MLRRLTVALRAQTPALKGEGTGIVSTRQGGFGFFRSRYSTEPADKTAATEVQDGAKQKIALEEKVASLQDSYLRALADQENLRQRTKKEVEAAGQFAIQKFAKEVIAVADVLETAVTQQEEATDGGASSSAPGKVTLLKGMQMTLEELQKVLRAHGVTPLDPLHQRFDPHQHMALYEVPTADVEPGTVVSVQKKGYSLNGRVIRAAQVAIAKKP